MWPCRVYALVVCLVTVCWTFVVAQNVASLSYPMQPGDTWIYQNESRDGSMAHPSIERWKTMETIVSAAPIPEGTLVVKRTKVLDHVMLNGWLPENDHTKHLRSESYLLIHQDCLYQLREIDREDSEDIWSALDHNHQVRPQYRDALRRGNIAADLCFPLAVGMTWGRVPDTSPAEEDVWSVKGVNGDPFGAKGGTTFHLFAFEGSGEGTDRWFEASVGVLQEVTEHHGSYDEDRRRLLKTIIGGKPRSYQLTPARTVPWSPWDCVGVGWRHFARADGSSFRNQAACVSENTHK
jgi:hypothetical protein